MRSRFHAPSAPVLFAILAASAAWACPAEPGATSARWTGGYGILLDDEGEAALLAARAVVEPGAGSPEASNGDEAVAPSPPPPPPALPAVESSRPMQDLPADAEAGR